MERRLFQVPLASVAYDKQKKLTGYLRFCYDAHTVPHNWSVFQVPPVSSRGGISKIKKTVLLHPSQLLDTGRSSTIFCPDGGRFLLINASAQDDLLRLFGSTFLSALVGVKARFSGPSRASSMS